MITKPQMLAASYALTACLFASGCTGDPSPDPTPTATATATPNATPTVKASETPAPNYSPLGGKPATEAEKEYHNLQVKAKEMVLSRAYEDAIPLLEQAHEQQPDDFENAFYLLLSYGSLELVPSKGSAAYPYAKQVIELAPNSNEAERANAYLIGAEFEVPEDFKYGDKTIAAFGGFVFDPETPYKLTTDAPLHTEVNARLNPSGKTALWEAEVAPEMCPNTVLLEKGTEVAILSESHFFHSLTSWRKPLPPKPDKFDDTMFEIDAFYVEVVSDGDNKGKKGWLVNQVDRYLDETAVDPFGVWIPNRLNLLREVELQK